MADGQIRRASAIALLPGGLRDEVTVKSLENVLTGRVPSFMQTAFEMATRGEPLNAEQEARWRKLGLLP